MGDDFKTAIGAKLKEARVTARLTQADVAGELQRSRQAISSWEGGRTAPSLEEFRDMVTLYGVSADRVLYGVQDANAAMLDVFASIRQKGPGFVDSHL